MSKICLKVVIMMVLCSMVTAYTIPHRSTRGKDYLVSGNNTGLKIYYDTSSNFSRNHEGSFAMDSDTGTSWVSEKSDTPQWLEVDFVNKRIMTHLVVYPGKKDGFHTIRYFVLQFMHRGEWFDFKKVVLAEKKKLWYMPWKHGTSYHEKVKIPLGGVDASTFRVMVPDDAMIDGHAAIAEVEVYAGSQKLQYFDERLYNLCFPVKNGLFPESRRSYPNAPREYRGGRHVGLDVYYYHDPDTYEPIRVDDTTPVVSIAPGTVVRADVDYEPMTPEEWKKQSQFYSSNARTFVKRSFGGIQVWIDHGNGILSTYNHLSKLDSSIKHGARVSRGERIGWIGNSGLYGEAEGKDYGMHLHFEIWIDGHYLGYGMEHEEVKRYLQWMFTER